MFSTGKKIAIVVSEKPTESIIPSGNTFIIRPALYKLNPIYLKAFLEFIPSSAVHASIKTNLLTKKGLEKLLIPLPELAIQESLISDFSNYKELTKPLREISYYREQYKKLWNLFYNSRRSK